MKKPVLRIFDASAEVECVRPQPSVRMNLREIYPLLVHAHHLNYQWLKDLADDEIVVTQDLADILRAFDTLLPRNKSA